MLHIAVCDDEPIILEKINSIISEYCNIKGIANKLFLFSDGSDLLEADNNFDIIFLDIEMQHSNGIEVAQQIRDMNMNVPIVYITSYKDYWRRAYKVHAFDFIVKPFEDEEIHKVIKDYFALIRSSDEETITFPTEHGVVCYNVNDIYYFMFEAKKKVYVQTENERVLVKEHLNDIYKRLNKERFYKSRRDCIVNLKYVHKTKNDFVIVMKNGDLLPLAQKKKEEFMQKLSSTFVEKLKGRNI